MYGFPAETDTPIRKVNILLFLILKQQTMNYTDSVQRISVTTGRPGLS